MWHYVLIMNIILSLLSLCHSAETKPSWITERPIDPDYYIGVGYAQIDNYSQSHFNLARDNALGELVSEISISIDIQMTSIITQNSGLLEEDIRHEMLTSTRMDISDYELVDTWQNKSDYWVFYRLSKSLYQSKKKQEFINSKITAIMYFNKGNESVNNSNVYGAIDYYLRSFHSIYMYLNEDLSYSVDNQVTYLPAEIFNSLNSLLNTIDITILEFNKNIIINKNINLAVPVSVISKLHKNKQVPVSNLPLKFLLTDGAGDYNSRGITNKDGFTECRIKKITSNLKSHSLTASLNIRELSAVANYDTTSKILNTFLQSFIVPKVNASLSASKISLYVESREINLGKEIYPKILNQEIGLLLNENNINVVVDPDMADFKLKLDASTRRGKSNQYFSTAFLSITYSIFDNNSKQTIFKSTIDNIKGAEKTFKSAGSKAFDNAKEDLRTTVMPKLLKILL